MRNLHDRQADARADRLAGQVAELVTASRVAAEQRKLGRAEKRKPVFDAELENGYTAYQLFQQTLAAQARAAVVQRAEEAQRAAAAAAEAKRREPPKINRRIEKPTRVVRRYKQIQTNVSKERTQ